MGTPNVGKCVQFGMDSVNPVTKQYEVLWPFDFGKRGTLVESNGLRGTRQRVSTGVNAGVYTVGGRVPVDLRPDTADIWWYAILGTTKTVGNIVAFAETIPEWYVTVDRGADVATSAGCKAASATLSGRASEDLRLEVDLEGKTEVIGDAASFPDISASLSVLQPYIFHQGVYTLGSTPYPFDQFSLTVNNALILDRFMNTQSRSALPEGDQIISLQTSHPWTSDEKTALYDIAVTGLAATLVFTSGSNVMTLTFGNLKAPVQPPNVRGRELEVMLPLNWTAYKKGTADALKVTNVWAAGSGV